MGKDPGAHFAPWALTLSEEVIRTTLVVQEAGGGHRQDPQARTLTFQTAHARLSHPLIDGCVTNVKEMEYYGCIL